jgi:hypothetical protein
MASNSRRNEIFNFNDVINSNDLRKQIVNVDSRFRDIAPKDNSTNFQYTFEHPYKNVIRIRIASSEIPNSWYEFDDTIHHNTSFVISAYDISNNLQTVIIQIADGNYSAIDLVSTIQAQFVSQLQIPYGIFMSIYPNPFSLKATIELRGVAPLGVTAPTTTGRPFYINFLIPATANQPYNWGLGYNLGFRSLRYTVSNITDVSGGISTYSVQSESLIDVTAETYVFLAVNDYYTVENKNTIGFTQALAKIIVRDAKYSILFDDGGSLMSNDVIFPSPIDLKRIQVKLLDPYGRVIDLNGLNFSFSLEITEVTNTKMYEFYRNYIWLGTVPSLPSNVTGSGMGLLGGKGP